MHTFILLCAMAFARPEPPISGTPKTLNQAIRKAFQDHAPGGLILEDRIEVYIADFLAQKFAIQALKNQACEDILIQTYTMIRGRPPGGVSLSERWEGKTLKKMRR